MRFFYPLFLIFILLLGQGSIYAQGTNAIKEVFEYVPAPGQFVNTSIGQPNAAKQLANSGSGMLTLGGFGGFVVLSMEHPVKNDPKNLYGVDFTIYSNATDQSIEPAAVYVMKDNNLNGLPDDTWYLLAGSDYWFSSTIPNYSITYQNPGGDQAVDVPWSDNLGNAGVIPANEFHTQPYYPQPDSFPDMGADTYTLKGCRIVARLDKANPGFVKAKRHAFGYADNTKTIVTANNWLPDNPYTRFIEGRGGDGFDISWAIDENNRYVELDEISFIKIQNATNEIAGWLGELSTEIAQIVDVEPASASDAPYQCIVIEPDASELTIGDEVTLNSYYFEWGKPIEQTINWLSSDNELASINQQGMLTANSVGQCTIYAKYAADESIYDSILVQVQEPLQINSKTKNKVFIYPNPATDFLFVHGAGEHLEYRIYETSGKVIQSGNYMDRINISGCKPGVYFIELNSETIGATQILMVQ